MHIALFLVDMCSHVLICVVRPFLFVLNRGLLVHRRFKGASSACPTPRNWEVHFDCRFRFLRACGREKLRERVIGCLLNAGPWRYKFSSGRRACCKQYFAAKHKDFKHF